MGRTKKVNKKLETPPPKLSSANTTIQKPRGRPRGRTGRSRKETEQQKTGVVSSPVVNNEGGKYLNQVFEFVEDARGEGKEVEYEDEGENPERNPLELPEENSLENCNNNNPLETSLELHETSFGGTRLEIVEIHENELHSLLNPSDSESVLQDEEEERVEERGPSVGGVGGGAGVELETDEEEAGGGEGDKEQNNNNNNIGGGEGGTVIGVELVDDPQAKKYGTLVIWEGNSSEPVFQKKAVKKGRFYIVNCGEPRSSYQNRCHKPVDTHHQQHLPGGATTSSSAAAAAACTCCAGGCPTFNNQFDPECTKRVNRRRPKGPKKVQLVTKEEHHKILNSFIEEKKYEPDFKVDSLFAPRDDPNHNNNNNNQTNQQMTETAPPRRTRLQNKTAPRASKQQQQQQLLLQQQQQEEHQHHHHQLQQQQQHQIIENKQVVSFTVIGNQELIDDVAGYEMVDSNALSNDSDQSKDDLNPEFGIHLNSEDEMPSSSTSEQRTKRTYRMRKPTNKDIPGEIVCDLTGKPRCTYTDLIEKALQQSENGLTVSEIYTWISSNYNYFHQNDDRWKNSVRHNLSINPYFKKADKATNGAGHLWVIAEEGKGIRPPMRRRSDSDNIMDSVCYDSGDMIPIRNETDRAISVILSEYAMASMQHNQQNECNNVNVEQCGGSGSGGNHNHNQNDDNSQDQHEQPPVTYIQIPNEIAIGNCTNNENQHYPQSQVICYENLPDGSYAIDLHTADTQTQMDDMYTLTDFTDGNVIMVNIEDSDTKHEEQMTERLELDDVFVSDFSVLNTDGNDLMAGMAGTITNWLQ